MLGCFDAEIFLLTVSEVLGIVADESGLTLGASEVLRTTGVWARTELLKKGKRKVQGVLQSQTAALPRPQEEEETDKSKQAQTEQTYEKH